MADKCPHSDLDPFDRFSLMCDMVEMKYKDLEKKNQQLCAENEVLKAENEALKKEIQKLKNSKGLLDEEDDEIPCGQPPREEATESPPVFLSDEEDESDTEQAEADSQQSNKDA